MTEADRSQDAHGLRVLLYEQFGDDVEAVDWHGTDLTTASPEELEGVLADTVLAEFKTRLGRIGIDYQSPSIPV